MDQWDKFVSDTRTKFYKQALSILLAAMIFIVPAFTNVFSKKVSGVLIIVGVPIFFIILYFSMKIGSLKCPKCGYPYYGKSGLVPVKGLFREYNDIPCQHCSIFMIEQQT